MDVTSDPQRFLAVGSEFLYADPVLNSVLLSVATSHVERAEQPAEPAIWALIREGSAADDADGGGPVLGAAMRTPPRGILVSRLPAGGAAALTEALLPTCAEAPSVGGPAPDIEEFAQLWSARVGGTVELGMAQRIHRLDRVFGVTGVRGRARKARAADQEALTEWTLGFHRDAATVDDEPPTRDVARAEVERRLAAGRTHVWDDGGPVSFLGTTPALGGIVRIGPVYTPPEYRARGYASALTAAVSRQALQDGADACSLYTDLANPTSNQIYAAVGYRPLCDATTYLVRRGS